MGSLLQHKNELIVIVLLALCGIVCFNLFTQYTNERDVLQAQQRQLEKKEQLVNQWNQESQRYQEIAATFPFKDPMQLRQLIEGKARTNRVKIISLNPTRRDEGIYQELAMRLDVSGEYDTIAVFIAELEKSHIPATSIMMQGGEGNRQAHISVKSFIVAER